MIQLKLYIMNLFTLSESIEIVKYYTDKVIGKHLLKESLITDLKVEAYPNNKFMVFCFGQIFDIVLPKRNIYFVAEYLNLISPDEVLKGLNQKPINNP